MARLWRRNKFKLRVEGWAEYRLLVQVDCRHVIIEVILLRAIDKWNLVM